MILLTHILRTDNFFLTVESEEVVWIERRRTRRVLSRCWQAGMAAKVNFEGEEIMQSLSLITFTASTRCRQSSPSNISSNLPTTSPIGDNQQCHPMMGCELFTAVPVAARRLEDSKHSPSISSPRFIY